MRIVLIVVALALLTAICASAAPLGEPGTSAVYHLDADPAERPSFERENRLTVVSAKIKLGPVEVDFQWYGLEWTRLDGQTYSMWILIDRWPTAAEDPTVLGYLWQEPDWPDAVHFAHEVNGEPVLPRISLWTYGWPQDPELGGGKNRAPVSGTPERILLHGWQFKRVSTAKEDVRPPSAWTTVKLNPDLLIGWIAKDRDQDGRPHYRLSDGQYKYTSNTEDDLTAHIRAGGNFFVYRPLTDELDRWLARSHVWHGSLDYKRPDWPVGLYRSNYWGMMNHHDEPALSNLGRKGTPAEVAQGLQKIVAKADRPTNINDSVAGRFGLGSLIIEENDNPTWEVLWETAWYQLAMPNVGGIVDEDTKMEGPGVLVDLYNMSFSTQIPNTIENSCAIRTAVMRGAARNFGKRWGVGLYEPDGVKIRSTELPIFYEKGATYFWTWTGWVGLSDNSGLPYPYQRHYFSILRQAAGKSPNRDSAALLRAAKVAVVIPYGYTFSPWHMHRTVWLPLEKKNQHGVTYRQVLSNAAVEVERLLRLGIEFDIAVDDHWFNPEGYEELVYAREDGIVRVVRPGQRDLKRALPRPVDRPNLGPMPTLTIESDIPDPSKPNKMTFRALAEIGTGDWSGETVKPTVYWEIYDADSILELTYSALWLVKGETLTHEFKQQGQYTVRASVVDVFGRPAVAYKTVGVAVAD